MEISIIIDNKEIFNKRITLKNVAFLMAIIGEKALIQYSTEAIRCLGGF